MKRRTRWRKNSVTIAWTQDIFDRKPNSDSFNTFCFWQKDIILSQKSSSKTLLTELIKLIGLWCSSRLLSPFLNKRAIFAHFNQVGYVEIWRLSMKILGKTGPKNAEQHFSILFEVPTWPVLFLFFEDLSNSATSYAFVGEINKDISTLFNKNQVFCCSVWAARTEPIDRKCLLVLFASSANWFEWLCLFVDLGVV